MTPVAARKSSLAIAGGAGPPTYSREAAQECSPGRKPWVRNRKGPSPSGAKEQFPNRLLSLLIVEVAALALLVACGYHTAGHTNTLPTDIKTIAVPAFINNTETYKIEQMLTASVVREFTTRTRYHVLNAVSDDADATLRGTVLSAYTAPLTYDSQTGRVASVLITVNMKVVLTGRHDKVLYQNPAYVFHEQYEVSTELNSFFEEDSPALERLSRDFARTLVSNILEGF